ncbi:ARM repeat-containing protein [Phanerochaete sordida]|uniref:ARM repeat-containing protein n=1 Tax=Phanerochaete sordida TaxID=48140 RepID=A0A9P3GHV4_9APHY|nr:ARM repeat-containing protein [Phanerochaete sordida]
MQSLALDIGPAAQPRSPAGMHSNPFEATSSPTGARVLDSPQGQHRNPFNDMTSIPPPSPSLASAQASSGTAMLSQPFASSAEQRPPSPGASSSNPGLHIEIPPAHHAGNPFVPSGATVSPPPSSSGVPPHSAETLPNPMQSPGQPFDLGQEVSLQPANAGESSLSVDYAEFDSEGLSALEKIYLFSRSRAGFQRVFIAHALPSYLRHRRESGPDRTEEDEGGLEADEISPAEAVEYVLPLLNGLAMDEDETVKEALAAELVPIIWWFVTHCQLVEEDDAAQDEQPQPSDEPTRISVQSFTPILGTLLLSPNGQVGGPARFAVVELLNRVRRANARDRHDSEQREHSAAGPSGGLRDGRVGVMAQQEQELEEEDSYSPTGLFGSLERRLFEREMVQQVVIGMGRLDLPDEQPAFAGHADDAGYTPGAPTPVPSAHVQGVEGSYFPAVNMFQGTPAAGANSTPPATTQPPESSPSFPQYASPLSFDTASPSSTQSPVPSLTADSPSSLRTASGSSSHVPITPPNPVQYTSPEDAKIHGPSSLVPPPLVEEDELPTPEAWIPPHVASILSPRPQSPRFMASPPHALPSSHPSPLRPPSPCPSGPRPPSPPPPERNVHSPSQSHVVESRPIPIDTNSSFQPDIAAPNHSLASGDAYHPSHDVADVPDMHPFGDEGELIDDAELSEEASVGRLSSMSLMAAVTASGSIDEETKAAFVTEVERVGRDPVYWVRREASFAVGALAKVVPHEVVLISLLPLFESLYRDPSWHVRHSALFALPAILSRLPPPQRRTLALDVIVTLSRDEAQTVRSGVLEALAEVIYTFHEDADGPPPQLLRLFLGIREHDDPRLTEQHAEEPPPQSPPTTPMSWSEFVSSISVSSQQSQQDHDIYEDPARPLICAFNYPAVALTLGRERWHEIRELYLELSQNTSQNVRKTLAASLGEMAKIVGPVHAKQDLLPVWWSSIRSEEAEVRLKAVECLGTLVPALGDAERAHLLKGLNGEVWTRLKGWREREAAIKALGGWASISAIDEVVLRGLLRKGLQDSVASVREEAVHALAGMVSAWKSRPNSLDQLWEMLRTLAVSNSYRHRTIFLVCYQTVLLATKDVGLVSAPFLRTLEALSRDPIVDVRIKLARFLGTLQEGIPGIPQATVQAVREIAKRLAEDPSHDVQAFAQPFLAGFSTQNSRRHEMVDATKSAHIFSRPPPLAPS